MKWGIKVDVLADWKTGYNWRFRVYSGRTNVPEGLKALGKLGYIVAQLVSGLEHSGRKITMDRGYSSPILFQYLAKLGLGASGTINITRKGFPSVLVKKKALRGEWDWLRSGNLICMRWYDSNQNYFLSNYHYPEKATVKRRDKTGKKTDVQATKLVADYNCYMNAVDKLDQNTILDKGRKQYRWHMRIFVKALEWCVHNAFVLERLDKSFHGTANVGRRKHDHLAFRMDLITQLVGFERVTKKRLSDPVLGEERLNKELDHFPECGIGSDHRCVVCEERFRRFRKKYPEKSYKEMDCKSIKTSFRCTGCNAYLCLKRKTLPDGTTSPSNCWRVWHQLKEFWRPMPWEE